MNIGFYSAHMETLSDLMKIAEKHNCTITFDVTSSHEAEIDEDILKRIGFTEELLEEMKEKMTLRHADGTFDKVCFDLYEKNTKTHHSMAYIESSTWFTAEEDPFPLEEISYELTEVLQEHDQMLEIGVYTISEHYNPTIIHGFGNKEKIEDFRVYRSGMALKFFGDLVCDYLNEPRIHRVY